MFSLLAYLGTLCKPSDISIKVMDCPIRGDEDNIVSVVFYYDDFVIN